MKRLACLSALLCVLATADAASYSATGAIGTLHSEDSSRGAESNWFSIVGVDSLGTCKTSSEGHVVFLLPDYKDGRRMFDLALASRTSGSPLKIWVDDIVTGASGFCLVTAIE